MVFRRSLEVARLQHPKRSIPAHTRLVLALELGERTDLHTIPSKGVQDLDLTLQAVSPSSVALGC